MDKIVTSHIELLQNRAKALASFAEDMKKAQTLAELDQAKLNGLNIYQETLREANRAFMEFNTLARTERARITNDNYESARKAAHSEPVGGAWTTNEVYLEPVEPPKPKKAKATKKTTKKAKK